MFRNLNLTQEQTQKAIDRIITNLDKLNDWGLGRVTGYMESLMTMPMATKAPTQQHNQEGMPSLF